VPSDIRAALAAYDLVAGTLLGAEVSRRVARRAFAASPVVWNRLLGLEGCGEQFRHRLRESGLWTQAPVFLQRTLDEAAATSIRRAILIHVQLAEIASLGASLGIRVLALKGAARLLGGEMPGMRSIGDIDLLVAPANVEHFHTALREHLGYRTDGDAYPHHAPGLTRAGSLGVEIHWRLSDQPLALDNEIWRHTYAHRVGEGVVEIPSSTNMVLHTLEHAGALNWDHRFRLRDILDVADTWTAEVSAGRTLSHVEGSTHRAAFETLMAAAHLINGRVPACRRDGWRTVRRVARVRVAAGMAPRDRRLAMRFFRYASVVAEGSSRSLWRAGRHLVKRTMAR